MNLGAKNSGAGRQACRPHAAAGVQPQNPVFELAFAPEHQRELERLLAALPPEVFTADDSLGWVYQFWQTKRRRRSTTRATRSAAHDLPAVTQLFTEHYMVEFLLHNSLGAWWAGAPPRQARCPVTADYLRCRKTAPRPPARSRAGPSTPPSSRCWTPAAARVISWWRRSCCSCRCAWKTRV